MTPSPASSPRSDLIRRAVTKLWRKLLDEGPALKRRRSESNTVVMTLPNTTGMTSSDCVASNEPKLILHRDCSYNCGSLLLAVRSSCDG